MIEFDKNPDVHFFLCRQCRAHIALDEEHLLIDVMNVGVIFSNAVNVEVEDNPRRHIIAGICTAAEARCSRCMLHLGWKFVRVPDEHFVFQAGRFLLYLECLMLWNGSKTFCPVEESESEEENDTDG
ncbi:Protein yippee-like [Actinidia chinensis var. chinensis]|uniref:Protein yippee-like n=1 Tax=Actinidia chinensis var. chinensis TaxID=1590841 RepID=A0A2R6PF85_ACTCC|nr:Protein yippee-like [Actinidia chinensis var. chinensis]